MREAPSRPNSSQHPCCFTNFRYSTSLAARVESNEGSAEAPAGVCAQVFARFWRRACRCRTCRSGAAGLGGQLSWDSSL